MMQASTPSHQKQGTELARRTKRMPASEVARVLREGLRSQHSGDHTMALECAQRILEAYPQHLSALQLKGQSQLMAGDAQACVETMSLLLAFTPRVAIALNNRAVALAPLGRTDQAHVYSAGACRSEPDYPDARV